MGISGRLEPALPSTGKFPSGQEEERKWTILCEKQDMKKWIYIGLCVLSAGLLLSTVCAVDPSLPSGETVGQWLWYDRAALVAAACIGVGAWWGRKEGCLSLSVAVSWALMGWASVQAVWGMCQLFGLAPSGHALYALTGSFFNPGPYSGYLAMVLPVCLHEYLCRRGAEPVGRYAAGLAGLLILCVLPAGMSRSAWLAAGVSCLWVYGCHAGWGRRLRAFRRQKPGRFRMAVAGLLGLACLTGVLLFQLKPDSALGRLFMWRMSARAVAESPWTGHGAGSFASAYGGAQEAYFAAGGYAPWEERVAGCPEYAFNEYLQAAVEYGVPLALCLLAVGVGGWWQGVRRKRTGCCAALLSLAVFACSSYPLQLPVFVVTGGCLWAACVCGGSWRGWLAVAVVAGGTGAWRLSDDRAGVWACREWMNARVLYQAGAYASAGEEYARLCPLLRDRAAFLFEYGHGLHRQEKHEASNRVLEEALQHSCDPMILNVMGKNWQALGDGRRAEQCFLRSVHRLPGRIYPYYLLAKLYASPQYRNPRKLAVMKRLVLDKVPKVPSQAIREMRKEVEDLP